MLVPIDGSKYGEIAVAYASMLAKSCGAYIELLSVVNVGNMYQDLNKLGQIYLF
ncbi:MAG: universal stress protein [Veillonella sp.]|nr:universal stress protein [Veillonella sp.]